MPIRTRSRVKFELKISREALYDQEWLREDLETERIGEWEKGMEKSRDDTGKAERGKSWGMTARRRGD